MEPRSSQAMADINITPFVDVVLVLLIIFLITAPMMIRGIDVNVPKTTTRGPQTEERLIITLAKNRVLYLGDQPATPYKVESTLVSLHKRNPAVAIYIRADSNVPYGDVVKIMDIAKKIGIDKVGIITEPLLQAEGGG